MKNRRPASRQGVFVSIGLHDDDLFAGFSLEIVGGNADFPLLARVDANPLRREVSAADWSTSVII